MLNVERLIFYFFEECTYVASDDTGHCAIIDPGCARPAEKERLFSLIEEKGLSPKVILLTHGHIDHIFGVSDCVRRYSVPVYMDAAEEETFSSVNTMFSSRGVKLPEKFEYIAVKDGDVVRFGNSEVRALSTPGHSKGSLCWWFEKDKILFSGDTLFAGSVGRTDLAGGSLDELQKSLRNTLMQLDGEIDVYPGHGPSTSIGRERMCNPFIE